MIQRIAYTRTVSLAADEVVADLAPIAMSQTSRMGDVSIYCQVASGTPAGVWELYSSGDGVNFTRLDSSAITAELALIAPAGGTVDSVAILLNVPGTHIKVRYNKTSSTGSAAITVVC